jgi:hypothetical protein
VLVRSRLDGCHRALTGHVELGTTQGNAARLCGRKSLTGTRGNECAFLLRKGSEQVEHEGINIRSKLRYQERNAVRHQS